MTQAFNLFCLRGQLLRPLRPVDHSGQPHHAAVRVRLDLVEVTRAQELAKSPRICDPRGRREPDFIGRHRGDTAAPSWSRQTAHER